MSQYIYNIKKKKSENGDVEKIKLSRLIWIEKFMF